MGLDPANTLQLGVGITAFVATIASVFVFSIAYKERVARLLGYSLLFFGLWGWLGFAFYIPDDLALAREFRLAAILFQIIAQIYGVLFCFAYLEESRPLSQNEYALRLALIVGNVFFFALYASDMMGTQFMAGNVYPNAAGLVLAPDPGPAALWFLAFYVACALACGFIIMQRAVREAGAKRRAAFIFAGSVVVSYILGTTGWLTWYDIETPLSYLRGLAIPVYLVAMFYSIKNYQLFNIRVAAAELFIFLLWGFLFIRVMLHDSLRSALPDGIILIAVIGVGLVFIRSIMGELGTRIKLEHLTDELRILNTSLDTKVNERTRELSLSREHVESLVAQLPIGLIEIKTDGTIVRANTNARAMLGPSCATAAHMSACPLLRTALTVPINPGTFHIQTNDQHPRDIEVIISSLTLDSGEGFAVVLNDVTELRSLERAKDQFLATAAHQLRTPIAALKWVFNLLTESPLPESQLSIVRSGAQGVENMERIAEDLMQSARATSGAGSYRFTEGDVLNVVASAISVAQPLAARGHIEIKATHDAHIPAILIDAKQLQSALQNIIDNAITYTPREGTVTITTDADENGVHVRVNDTGIGMDKEEQTHAFERFFRSKRAVELFANGTGLGLSIAKDIITAHHGTISLTSEPGVGTTVHVVLPRPTV